MNAANRQSTRWLTLIGTIITQFALGSVYTWSLFNSSLSDKLGEPVSQVAFSFGLLSLGLALSSSVAGKLQERFGASRMTIRHALQKLEQQGVVRIDRGRGAFVMDLMIQRSKEILGVTELMERKGLKCHSKVLHLERIKPDEHIREAMNLKETDEVYFLHRIRYANDEAIAVEYAHT